MPPIVRYLTHPQVLIEPDKDIPLWSLNEIGRSRVESLVVNLGALSNTKRIISSAETKAIETAFPLSSALGIKLDIRPRMHENDRSATGYLPPDEFEETADRFFAAPSQSIRGWETAENAQKRIVTEVNTCLKEHHDGDVLFVGHGAVGTLLFCALSNIIIDRRFDQLGGGGGCWFQFDLDQRRPVHGWRPMEMLNNQIPIGK